MKRIFALILAAVMSCALFGCALTEESGVDFTMKALSEAEEVTVHLYLEEEEKLLDLEVTEELCNLLKGEWEKVSGRGNGKKVLTVTVGTQHEITLFDNGRAMIYYGYASVVEKDRCYYVVDLDGDVDSLYGYCEENGTVHVAEE